MRVLACCILGFVSVVSLAVAQEEEERVLGWTDVAEFSLVATGGNSEAQSISFKNVAVKTMEEATFSLDLGALRAESTTKFALGSADSFVERDSSDLTAENYYLRGRYDRPINERLFWYASAGWDRNTFAGIDNRYIAAAGFGHVWFDRETARFRTDYGLTFTRQEDTSGIEEEFAGLRLGYDYWRQINAPTEFGSVLLLDPNLEESDDWRADFTNWIGVSMSERLALRVSLQILYDNLPSLGELPLFSAPGISSGEVVLAELDEIDSILTVGLIVNF